MNDQRRTILKGMTAMAAASVTGIAKAKSGYDPKAKFDLKVSEVPFRKNAAGRQLMARIYQPSGAGPFPVVLDLHGGEISVASREGEGSEFNVRLPLKPATQPAAWAAHGETPEDTATPLAPLASS